jgi:hypothetical protein
VIAPNEVRVACKHGQVTTFVASSVPDFWIISVRGAEPFTDDAGAQRWHQPMRCDLCRLSVPAANMDLIGPFLDRLVGPDLDDLVRLGAVKWVSPTAVEVPLALMARAAGASWRLPDDLRKLLT